VSFTYNSDGYNTDGYFLAVEESFAATPKAVATSTGGINSSLTLLSNASAINSIVGGISLTMPLASNSLVTTLLKGDVNPSYHYALAGYNLDGYFLADEVPVAASSIAITSSIGAINSSLTLLSNASTVNTVIGSIGLTQTLLSNAQANGLGTGDIYSTMVISGNMYAIAIYPFTVDLWKAPYPLKNNIRSFALNGLNRTYPIAGIKRTYP
jgi:hypothetical protein